MKYPAGKVLFILFFLTIGAGALGWLHFFSPRVCALFDSPDGKYHLVVYRVPMWFCAPGQGSDHMAVVELRDSHGEVLARLSDRDKEAVMVRDVLQEAVIWDRGEVRFARVRMFRLP